MIGYTNMSKGRSAFGLDDVQSIDQQDGGGMLQAWIGRPPVPPLVPPLESLVTMTVGVLLHGS